MSMSTESVGASISHVAPSSSSGPPPLASGRTDRRGCVAHSSGGPSDRPRGSRSGSCVPWVSAAVGGSGSCDPSRASCVSVGAPGFSAHVVPRIGAYGHASRCSDVPSDHVDRVLPLSCAGVVTSDVADPTEICSRKVTCPLCQQVRSTSDFALAGQVVELEGPNGTVIRGRSRMKRAQRPAVVKVSYKDGVEEAGGQLQPIASRVLMKILYAARVCRFDLLRAVGVLAQRVTTWDHECDRRLHRLMCYISCHTSLQLTGWIGDPLSSLRPHLFSDADLAGCAQTQRSTTGVLHTILGPNSSFPIAVV